MVRFGYNRVMSNATILRAVPRLTGTTGERIQSARGFHRWNQSELLDAMRVIDPEHTPVRKTLSNWENDHKSPTIREIALVASATGFPIEDFVIEDRPPTAGPPDDPRGLESDAFPCNAETQGDELAALRLSRTMVPAPLRHEQQSA